MEATAKVTGVRIAPRKVMLVIDLIRGKKVSDALGILANLNKSSSPVVAKLVKSAAANAVNNNKMDESKLYIKTIYANEGPRLKRFRPRAKGSAYGIIKRTSAITVVVADDR
jgi:large subunit ribosomal protein L22